MATIIAELLGMVHMHQAVARENIYTSMVVVKKNTRQAGEVDAGVETITVSMKKMELVARTESALLVQQWWRVRTSKWHTKLAARKWRLDWVEADLEGDSREELQAIAAKHSAVCARAQRSLAAHKIQQAWFRYQVRCIRTALCYDGEKQLREEPKQSRKGHCD